MTVFYAETLVTDTLVWEVIKQSEHNVWLRRTVDGATIVDEQADEGAYGLRPVWIEQHPNPDGPVKMVSIKSPKFGRKYRPAPTSEAGLPMRYVDLRT